MSTIKRLMACALSATLALVLSACAKSPTGSSGTLSVTTAGNVLLFDLYDQKSVGVAATGGDVSSCTWSSALGWFSNITADGHALLTFGGVEGTFDIKADCGTATGSLQIAAKKMNVDVVEVYHRIADQIFSPENIIIPPGPWVVMIDPGIHQINKECTNLEWHEATQDLLCTMKLPVGALVYQTIGDWSRWNPTTGQGRLEVGSDIYLSDGTKLPTKIFSLNAEVAYGSFKGDGTLK